MQFDFPYTNSPEDARARLEVLGEYLNNRHGILVTWIQPTKATFAGRYMVVKIQGELTVDPGVVRFRGEDPGMLWRKKATQYMQSKLAAYLDPGTPIEALPRDKK